jgi:hypothetical protein
VAGALAFAQALPGTVAATAVNAARAVNARRFMADLQA